MKIQWTKRARKSANEVGAYILQTFGEGTFDKFLQELAHTGQLLQTTLNLGHIEPLLEKRTYAYRSVIIHKRSKMIYRIDGENIYIVDFWNCKREPKKLTKGL